MYVIKNNRERTTRHIRGVLQRRKSERKFLRFPESFVKSISTYR